EMVHPHTIDHHASGQRIRFAGDGLGEFQPAAALSEWSWFSTGKNFEEMPGNNFTFRLRLSTHEDRRIPRLRQICDDHGAGWCAGMGQFQLVDLREEELGLV